MGVLERPPDHVGQVDFSNKRRAQEYAEPPTGAQFTFPIPCRAAHAESTAVTDRVSPVRTPPGFP